MPKSQMLWAICYTFCMNLTTKLSTITGIGYTFSSKLEHLGLNTVEDLLTYYPYRYDDFSNLTDSMEAEIGTKVTLKGEIWSIRNIYTRTRKVLTQAIFNDGKSPIELTWFNQQYLIKSIKVGDKLQISGKLQKYKNKLTIVAPVWEKMTENIEFGMQNVELKPEKDSELSTLNSLHTGRLVPIYSETEGLSSKWLRTKISQILPQVKHEFQDIIPEKIRKDLLPYPEAIQKIHFPGTQKEALEARNRLSFDELFWISLATQKRRQDWRSKPTIEQLSINNDQLSKFLDKLPFKLTPAQLRVIDEIIADLKQPHPMNRLVQGEVGSGKTVVAAVIAYLVHLNGLKIYLMAPTEILAFQHYQTFQRLLDPFGVSIGIYTGSRKYKVASSLKLAASKKKPATNYQLLTTEPDIVIGTHALISEKLNLENVGLVIVDEQQRFGVEQRTILRNKARIPHFLTMTATPIPRTIALTLYGDLDISVIDELPKGRQVIKTHVVPNKKRNDAYSFIEKQIKAGDQAYIITPLIDLSESMQSAKAATIEFEKLQKEVFPDLKLGLLHGRLKPKDKQTVLDQFKNGEVQILVSTSVVEVGVDVPNATIMVIENAERFGLAGLHQLRGRIGRGEKQSYCLLFSAGDTQDVSRLKNLEKVSNGLELSELDLKIRGSGQIFGTLQSGRFELKIASFSDLTTLERSKFAASEILAEDPLLAKYPAIRLKLDSFGKEVSPD